MTTNSEAFIEQLKLICDLSEDKDEQTIELLARNLHKVVTTGAMKVIDPYDTVLCEPLQDRTDRWMVRTFPPSVRVDITERLDRFIEEVFELAQSLDYDFDRISKLATYVGGRERGKTNMELGGVANTLFALCNAVNLSFDGCYAKEMERVETDEMVAKIRAKWEAKPADVKSPLPGKSP